MNLSKNNAIQATLEGDWEKAIKLNKALVESDPKDIEALNRLGLAYTILGKHRSAKKAYEQVLSIDSLNSIAIKNLEKLNNDSNKGYEYNITIQVNNIFLEESGKTKIVELVNLAQPEILLTLRTGQSVEIAEKRLKIFVSEGKKYIGVLPDDIGKRLIKHIKGGNKYETYVKSATHQNVSVFIRELKRSARLKDQPSFIQAAEKKLKVGKRKSTKKKS